MAQNIITKEEAAAIKVDDLRFNKTHRNSLDSKAGYDPVLKEKIRRGRRQANGDYNAMERWYEGLFVGRLGSSADVAF